MLDELNSYKNYCFFQVRMDLKDIYMICRGEKKQTNDHRKLISDLTRGIIPKSWKVDYKIPRDTTVKY